MKLLNFKTSPFQHSKKKGLKTKNPSANKDEFEKDKSDKKSKSQADLVPENFDQLKEMGITEEDHFKIKFHFNGSGKKKLRPIEVSLKQKCRCANVDKDQFEHNFILAGYTYPLPMQKDVLKSWAEDMCQIANYYNLEFLGWGIDV